MLGREEKHSPSGFYSSLRGARGSSSSIIPRSGVRPAGYRSAFSDYQLALIFDRRRRYPLDYLLEAYGTALRVGN